MKYFLIALTSILLLGCSTSQKAHRKLVKGKRFLLEAEALGAKWSRDTIYRDRIIYIPGDALDTLLSFDNTFGTAAPEEGQKWAPQTIANLPGEADSVKLGKGKLRIETVVQWRTRTIKIKGECIPDTVVISAPIAVNNTLDPPPCQQKFRIWDVVILCLVTFVVGAGVSKLLWK